MPYPALSPAAPSDPVAFRSAPSANRPPQGAPAPGSTAPFKPFRIDPLNRGPDAVPAPGLDHYIASMIPLISANPRDAPHSRYQRRRQEIFAADERR